MSQKHLTGIYRPQTFAEVVGQEPIRRILSRTAQEQKIAPAYMFSGTRGIGKTTIARILAKAINCRKGPAAEPCNECDFCNKITQGTSMDVYEIDGASHTGVDNIRKLNEEVGYAPIELHYKVIIIDEAHMLSKSSFNALLKTLEEPPPHVTFVLVTTEPHKFPATIVSRCQHYVFKRVPQKELEQFLVRILHEQGVDYEQNAINVLAKKGAGSVRDCLSLLSQVTALGREKVTADIVRELLGIAGQELMFDLLESISRKDCLRIVEITRDLLNSGLDLGFFLQEFTNTWRNLFLLKQCGERSLEILEMPREEALSWMQVSRGLSLSFIHAAWQMTLEGQKNIMSSLEPGLAMELLFLNISYLKDLIPVQDLNSLESSETEQKTSNPKTETFVQNGQTFRENTFQKNSGYFQQDLKEKKTDSEKSLSDWQGFLDFLQKRQDSSILLPNMNLTEGIIKDNTLELHCPKFLSERLKTREKFDYLQKLLREYFQSDMQLEILNTSRDEDSNSNGDLRKKVMDRPIIREIVDEFQAKVIDVLPRE